MDFTIDVTDEDFQEKVIKKSKDVAVVVEFYADWCPPCRMLGLILEKLAKEYKGKFILAKANVDQNRTKSQEYFVTGIPAIKLFKNKEIVDEFVGAMPETNVKAWLDKNL